MDVSTLVDHFAAQGPQLAGAAQRVDWDTAVPRTDWTVRELMTHVGGVHRWATDIVRTAPSDPGTALWAAVGSGPGDDELLDWFLAGHADLLDALRNAPADLQVPTFLPADSPLHFWARRQTHELAIHRADAQAAAGEEALFPVDLAQDGIAELLGGFGRRRGNAVAAPGTVGLDASDGPSWLITFGGERIESTVLGPQTEQLPPTDATVRGSSSDLYLWLWNRDCRTDLDGDANVAARWSERVRVAWS